MNLKVPKKIDCYIFIFSLNYVYSGSYTGNTYILANPAFQMEGTSSKLVL